MQQINVRRYRTGLAADGTPHIGNFWQGVIQPADAAWTMFIDLDGRPLVFLREDAPADDAAPTTP